MIGLMRDARFRVNVAAELTWGDVERVRGGSGRVRVVGAEETSYREGERRHYEIAVTDPPRRG